MTTFEEWWPSYLGSHRNPLTRKLHFHGINLYFLSWIPFIITLKIELLYLPLICLVIGYLMGAITHFKIEKNHPNAKHPFWGVKALWVMYGLIWINKMDEEMIRVFGQSFPSKDANLIINPKNELEFSKIRRLKISNELTQHPFTDYFDIFLLKHQHPMNVFIHVLSMVWHLICLLAIFYFKALWPVLLIPVSMYMGHWAHKKFEDNFVDPMDALGSPRAVRSLWKMLWLYLTGQYWSELKKRQLRLLAFKKNKEKHV